MTTERPRIATLVATTALAVALPSAAVAAVRIAGPGLDQSVYMLLLAAVVVSGQAGGVWPGLVATATSVALANYHFVPPPGGAVRAFTADRVHLALFAALGVLLAALGHARRRSRLHARSQAARLAALNAELRSESAALERLAAERAEAARTTAALNGELTRLNGELRAAARRAEAARADAESANRSKASFLTAVSHELRTPLGAILGYGGLLSTEIDGPLTERQRGFVHGIAAAGAHLLQLVDEVLDLERIDLGQLALRPARALAADVVGGALDLVRPQAMQRRVALDVRGDDDAAFFADPDRVRQVLVNLLANAVKFTGEGGTVAVTYARAARSNGDADAVVVRVRDSGPGIPAAERDRVFEPFVQLTPSPGSAAGGVGLGLTIGRRLAALMGGELGVESAPGEGATFTLRLPTAPPAAPAATAAAVRASPTPHVLFPPALAAGWLAPAAAGRG